VQKSHKYTVSPIPLADHPSVKYLRGYSPIIPPFLKGGVRGFTDKFLVFVRMGKHKKVFKPSQFLGKEAIHDFS
jgi:hypothetical protein